MNENSDQRIDEAMRALDDLNAQLESVVEDSPLWNRMQWKRWEVFRRLTDDDLHTIAALRVKKTEHFEHAMLLSGSVAEELFAQRERLRKQFGSSSL